jgi:hypothetical protein
VDSDGAGVTVWHFPRTAPISPRVSRLIWHVGNDKHRKIDMKRIALTGLVAVIVTLLTIGLVVVQDATAQALPNAQAHDNRGLAYRMKGPLIVPSPALDGRDSLIRMAPRPVRLPAIPPRYV